jgi:hypothetical protein
MNEGIVVHVMTSKVQIFLIGSSQKISKALDRSEIDTS